jgi:hypothetical protein
VGTASCDVRPDILERNRSVRWQGRSHRPEMGTRIHGDFQLSNHAAVLRLVCYAPARACALPPAELSFRYSLKKGGLSVCASCGLLWLLCRESSNDRQHSRILMPENVGVVNEIPNHRPPEVHIRILTLGYGPVSLQHETCTVSKYCPLPTDLPFCSRTRK